MRYVMVPNCSATDSPSRNRKKAIRMLNASSSKPLTNSLPTLTSNELAGTMNRLASCNSVVVSVVRLCQYATARSPTSGTLLSQEGGGGGPVAVHCCRADVKSRTASETAEPMITNG